MKITINQNISISLNGDIRIKDTVVVTINATIDKDTTRLSQVIRNNQLYTENLDEVMEGIRSFNGEIRKVEAFVKSDQFNTMWEVLNG